MLAVNNNNKIIIKDVHSTHTKPQKSFISPTSPFSCLLQGELLNQTSRLLLKFQISSSLCICACIHLCFSLTIFYTISVCYFLTAEHRRNRKEYYNLNCYVTKTPKLPVQTGLEVPVAQTSIEFMILLPQPVGCPDVSC